MSLIDSLWFWL